MSAVLPLRDNIYVEKLDVGREVITPGGIIIPATTQSSVKTKSDLWRGRVLAVGPDVRDVSPGNDVIVLAWAGGDGTKLFTGEEVGGFRTFVKPDDVVCEVDADAEVSW